MKEGRFVRESPRNQVSALAPRSRSGFVFCGPGTWVPGTHSGNQLCAGNTRVCCALQEADLIRLKRAAKAENGFYVEPEAKLAFVVRIRGINDMHPKTKKILQLLRLRQIHNGVFLRVSGHSTQQCFNWSPWGSLYASTTGSMTVLLNTQ